MKTIHKYALRLERSQEIWTRHGAEMLDVQVQGDVLCLWALVELDEPAVTRVVHIVGTGHGADDLGRYIATVQLGEFVWHVFDEVQP